MHVTASALVLLVCCTIRQQCADGFVANSNGGGLWRAQRACRARSMISSRSSGRCSGSTTSRGMMAMEGDGPMADNKMLHVVYRVGDMDKAVEFYTKVLGMEVLRSRDVPEEKYSNAFVGYGTESKGEHFSIEFTYNYGVTEYDLGDGFRGIGLNMPDMKKITKAAEANGAKTVFGPADLELGASLVPDEDPKTVTIETNYKVSDPDGYTIQVVEKQQRDPVALVSINVLDLDKSIEFYQKALGMTLFRKRSYVPVAPEFRATLGYGTDEGEGAVVELVYEYARDKIKQGDAYGQIAVSTPDVYKAADFIREAGFEVTREPGPVPGIGTKITAVRDPDGYKIVLVDADDFEQELV